jgi:L-asparaginase II
VNPSTGALKGVVCVRAGVVESFHRVHVALVESGGQMVASWGRPDITVVYRSAAKPFQAVPLVEDGVVDHFGITPPELALAAASHNGEAAHLEGVRRILHRVGCREGDLKLGPLRPLGPDAADTLLRSGGSILPIHNNCSGQHAAMLGLARIHDWPLESYLEADHPLQVRMLAEMSRFTGLRNEEIATMVDGCGMVAFGVPLRAVAHSFARFGAAASKERGPREILTSMAGHPFMVGGTGRLCTRLAETTRGELIGKLGAEGVYGITMPREGLGLAVKVEDGGIRAGDPAVIRALDELSLLSPEAAEALEPFRRPSITNSRGERVGELFGTYPLRRGAAT